MSKVKRVRKTNKTTAKKTIKRKRTRCTYDSVVHDRSLDENVSWGNSDGYGINLPAEVLRKLGI